LKIQLELLSSRQDPTLWTIERFPCVIGRGPSANLRLEEPGFWEEHLRLDVRASKGVELRVLGDALATVNSQPVSNRVLKNGDVIEVGASQLRFWLGPNRQRDYRLRETLTWIALAALLAVEIWLVADALGLLWVRLF
jgi:hypothetical protein